MTEKISAFVIAYNRADLLRACLRRVRFVDELIVVDKSSTDETPIVARQFADRYEVVPWSPVVEDTRAYAQSLCTHDWIICLDDDEILSREAGSVFRELVDRHAQGVDVFAVSIRHYVLGRHDPRAMGDELRPTLYRRGAVAYSATVHAGNCVRGPAARIDGGRVWIDHLSHADVATWIEKANRYTSQPARSGSAHFGGDHVTAVHLLRHIYDQIDALKRWEATQPNGHATFQRFCAAIEDEFASV